MRSANRLRRTATGLPPLRQYQFSASLIGQEKFLERRSRGKLQAPPFLDGNKDRGFGAALGHHLRTFGKAGFEKLAESCLGVLNGP
jgi:hypothetical protein